MMNSFKGTENGDDHRPEKKRAMQFGSFYLRVGAIAFGIGEFYYFESFLILYICILGNMVYSGLELGQYFELQGGEINGCNNVRFFKIDFIEILKYLCRFSFFFNHFLECF